MAKKTIKNKQKKGKVWIVSCDQTELSNVAVIWPEEVGNLIGGDVENAKLRAGQELTYTVRAVMLTDKQYNSMPEYEG